MDERFRRSFVTQFTFGLLFVLVSFSVFHISSSNKGAKVDHKQVHLSLGSNYTEMIVTWTTLEPVTDTPKVRYGKKGTDFSFMTFAEKTEFKDDVSNFFTFRAILSNLEPDTVYDYQVGSKDSSWSEVHSFRSLKPNKNFLPRFAIFGDLGLENGVSIPYLQNDTQQSMYDVVFHIGDIAYNLHERNGSQGHDFMELIEPIAASLPYMTCSGNHERYGNFSHYDARFSMLSERADPLSPLSDRLNNHYYSFNIGPAHIIMFSSEFYFYEQYYGDYHLQKQYEWLEAELKKANKNRDEYPWVIVMAHRPSYCFNCAHLDHESLRLGYNINGTLVAGLEHLFYKYGVDLQFYGHQHHFARTHPVYDKIKKNHSGNGNNHYHDSEGPIHYITGSGGCRENHTIFNHNLDHVEFLAFYRYDYGYTRVTFEDRLKIKLEQTSVDHDGAVMDTVEISKSHPQAAWLKF